MRCGCGGEMTTMSNKQLFVVTVTTETVVLAEDMHEAEALARDDLNDIMFDGGGPDVMASPMTYYPGDMDEGCIPYGHRDDEDPDRTIGEWVDRGAAPKMSVVKRVGT
jgi:hypothetical protein